MLSGLEKVNGKKRKSKNFSLKQCYAKWIDFCTFHITMKLFCYIILFISASVFSQETIEVELLNKQQVNEQPLISIDNFNTFYYLSDTILFKEAIDDTINYSNVQLSNITSINTFNPLKINVFYKDFNTAVILDNRLSEIFKIDFNTNRNYKSISHISTGSDNTIWVYNQDNQQLELFDYKANKTRIFTLPILSEVLDLKSNYNYCWLLTETYLYKFNYFGSQILKIKNEGFIKLSQINENLILLKENKLFYLKNDTTQPIEIKLPKLLIKAFFVNNETLYIYDNEFLYKYQIKTN